ncbi:MAG: NYN domain-containing protein [Candidatus Limnocylindrales bacterium]
MGKNVAVFVDVANIFYAAKAAGVDIDYVTMLKSATAGRDLVRAYAYTGLDPDNENQRNFHDFLRRSNYKVVSKDIRKYGDGKVKANLDIELVVDMMKTARNLDVAIVVSGDGDFAPAIRAVQEMGVRVEVISFRGNTSSDLIEVADLFTDIVQIARVEKGSSRSGRRVATDDEDLSMTEVPDKQTEGTGVGRGRGRGRGRVAEGERTPVAARTGRGRPRTAVAEVAVAEANGGTGERPTLVALPGEKLSRAGGAAVAAASASAGEIAVDDGGGSDDLDRADGSDGPDGEEGRRRRRRGGRGRGRGRGRGEGESTPVGDASAPSRAREDDADQDDIPATPRAPKAAAFGSVWDSQIGVPASPGSLRSIPSSEEFDDEPAIPEYLIAERRGNGRSPNRSGGARGGRSGYSAAVDRERYGRGGSSGGINRYPDVSGRTGGTGPRDDRSDRGPRDGARRDDRGFGRGNRPERNDRTGSAPRPGEQWSEVPPELEAMLRAQMASGPAPRGGGRSPERSTAPQSAERSDRGSSGPETESPAKAVADVAGADAPKRRSTRAKAPAADATSTTVVAKPKRATAATTRSRAAKAPAGTSEAAAATTEKPKRAGAPRTTRAKTAPAEAAPAVAATDGAADKPKRRTTRAKVAADS